jgi:hypothetical protein
LISHTRHTKARRPVTSTTAQPRYHSHRRRRVPGVLQQSARSHRTSCRLDVWGSSGGLFRRASGGAYDGALTQWGLCERSAPTPLAACRPAPALNSHRCGKLAAHSAAAAVTNIRRMIVDRHIIVQCLCTHSPPRASSLHTTGQRDPQRVTRTATPRATLPRSHERTRTSLTYIDENAPELTCRVSATLRRQNDRASTLGSPVARVDYHTGASAHRATRHTQTANDDRESRRLHACGVGQHNDQRPNTHNCGARTSLLPRRTPMACTPVERRNVN